MLFYERAITKTVTSGQTDGPKTGMVAALDAEFFADTSGWQFPLDETLTPLPAASQPRPETLQAFQVQLGGLSSPPTVNLTVTTPTVVSGGMASVQASGYSDPEGDPIEVRIDWNNDGDFSDAGESGNMLSGSGGAPLTFTSPTPYTWSGSNPDNRSLPAQYTDNLSTPINVPGLGFTVVEAGASYCPVSAPWTNPAPITTGFGSSAIYTPPNRTEVEFDFGHFRVPTFNFPTANSNAGVVTQNIVDSATPSYELIRVSMNGPLVTDGVTFIPLTSAPGTFGSSNATARNLHQIEVDSTNRVVFARMQPG
ncbi:MAG TPA: hypothetical protein VEI97_04190, partial [bacterium]|nr:hypothetical protein [bacterium]